MKLGLLNKKPAKADRRIKLAGARGLLLALTLVFTLAVPALAMPLSPTWFKGEVRVANATGVPLAPPGTDVTAEIDDVPLYNWPTQLDDWSRYGFNLPPLTTGWTFIVPSDDNETFVVKEGGVEDDVVRFYIGNGIDDFYIEANETGNWSSQAHFTLNLTVNDNIPPAVIIDAMPDCTTNTAPTVTGTATDGLCAITLVEYRMDADVDWTPATPDDGTFDSINEVYIFTTPVLGDGTHTVYVKATDAADNTSAEVSDTFIVDTIDPVVVINAPANDGCYTTAATPALDYTVTEANAYTVVEAGYSTAEGVHTVTVTVTDCAGNEGSNSVTYTVDNTDPVVVITGVSDGVVYSAEVTPVITITDDNLTSSSITLNGEPFVSGITITEDGSYTLVASAEDCAGNTTEVTVGFTITTAPDTTPPSVESTTPVDGATDVAIDALVTATFDENVTAVDLTGITIDGVTGVSATLNEATDTITIIHDDFATATEYTVTIPAGAVQDLATVPNANEEYTWSFTTVFPESVYTLELGEDWNMISTPILLDSSCDTWGEFTALGDGLDFGIAYYYDGTSFQIVPASYPFEPCDAIYVKMNSADTAPIIPSSTTSGPPSKMLVPGWNLLGLASMEDLAVDVALNTVYLVTGDLTGYMKVVSPGLNQPDWVYNRGETEIPIMLVGKGYWVFMMNGGEYAGDTSTPWPGP